MSPAWIQQPSFTTSPSKTATEGNQTSSDGSEGVLKQPLSLESTSTNERLKLKSEQRRPTATERAYDDLKAEEPGGWGDIGQQGAKFDRQRLGVNHLKPS